VPLQKPELRQTDERLEEERVLRELCADGELLVDLKEEIKKDSFFSVFIMVLLNRIKVVLRLDRKKTRSFERFLREETAELTKKEKREREARERGRKKIQTARINEYTQQERRTAPEKRKIKKALTEICIWVQNSNSGEMRADWEHDELGNDYKIIVETKEFKLTACESIGVYLSFSDSFSAGHFCINYQDKLCFMKGSQFDKLNLDEAVKKLAFCNLKASSLTDSFFSFLRGDNFKEV